LPKSLSARNKSPFSAAIAHKICGKLGCNVRGFRLSRPNTTKPNTAPKYHNKARREQKVLSRIGLYCLFFLFPKALILLRELLSICRNRARISFAYYCELPFACLREAAFRADICVKSPPFPNPAQ
jgi:hypothetical protein